MDAYERHRSPQTIKPQMTIGDHPWWKQIQWVQSSQMVSHRTTEMWKLQLLTMYGCQKTQLGWKWSNYTHRALLWAQEAPGGMQGFDQMWQSGIGFTATSMWQKSLFDPSAVFLLQQFFDRGALNVLDSAVSSDPWKHRHHCWSWSINLLGILLGSWACSQRPSVNKRTKLPDVCGWNTKTRTASSPRSGFAFVWVCPLTLTSSWAKKAAKSTEAWTCSKFNVLFSILWLYLFQNFQKVTGGLPVGRLSKYSSHFGKPLVYSPWEWPTRYTKLRDDIYTLLWYIPSKTDIKNPRNQKMNVEIYEAFWDVNVQAKKGSNGKQNLMLKIPEKWNWDSISWERKLKDRNDFEIWAEIWTWKFQSLESWEMTFINSLGKYSRDIKKDDKSKSER